MVGSEVRIRTETPGGPQPLEVQGEAVLFVAAVAAALVEHRRLAGKAHPLAQTESSRANWTMVGRLEQLRGRA